MDDVRICLVVDSFKTFLHKDERTNRQYLIFQLKTTKQEKVGEIDVMVSDFKNETKVSLLRMKLTRRTTFW